MRYIIVWATLAVAHKRQVTEGATRGEMARRAGASPAPTVIGIERLIVMPYSTIVIILGRLFRLYVTRCAILSPHPCLKTGACPSPPSPGVRGWRHYQPGKPDWR